MMRQSGVFSPALPFFQTPNPLVTVPHGSGAKRPPIRGLLPPLKLDVFSLLFCLRQNPYLGLLLLICNVSGPRHLLPGPGALYARMMVGEQAFFPLSSLMFCSSLASLQPISSIFGLVLLFTATRVRGRWVFCPAFVNVQSAERPATFPPSAHESHLSLTCCFIDRQSVLSMTAASRLEIASPPLCSLHFNCFES